jgi:hypothetical protein
MTPAEARVAGEELARRSRAAQGLPRRVRDREVARRVASLLTPSESPRGHHSSGAIATATPTTRRSTYREPDYPDSTTIAS